MALATKCPQCGALFRVVADQLKLRGGLVRCGQCRAVFDAIGSLTYVDDSALLPTRATGAVEPPVAAAPPPATDESSAPRSPLGPATTFRIAPVPPATLAGPLPAQFEPRRAPPDEPAVMRRRARPARGADTRTMMTGTDAVVPTLAVPEAADAPLGSAFPEDAATIVEAPRDTAVDVVSHGEAPEFARPPRRRGRGFSIVYGGGSALLVALALIQFAVILRGQLMIHWPQARPLLVHLCSAFDCTVTWPTQPDQLAVIGTELQAIPGTDALELSAVVRNRAAFRQSLPAVEVTLTDVRNQALARKVFTPADYLASAGEPTARLQEGLAPGSDLAIRIFFEARGLAPAGFLVYPFYL